MLIALDYDGTYTLDPNLWDAFILLAKQNNHSVICVTMRYEDESEDVINNLSSKVDKIIFTCRKAKLKFIEDLGYKPDIWIDDMPHWLFNDSK